MIKRQLENSNDLDEYMKKAYRVVLDNVFELYTSSNMTLREFALFCDTSHSTIKRLIEKQANVEFVTICKIAACWQYPLECMVSPNLSPKNLNLINKIDKLDDKQRAEITKSIDKALSKQKKLENAKNQKIRVTSYSQMSLFDILNADTKESRG